jgi:eukaryotic-like serine/threonine-protein kinase
VNSIGTEPRVVRFGVFEVDLCTGELRKKGQRLRIPGQSFQVLKLLLERPGELVSREELREKIWGSDTFVDFEHGLNAAVNRLREALGDSADSPRFVETLPRRGYRFIAPLLGRGAQMIAGSVRPPASNLRRAAALGIATILVFVLVPVGLNVRGWRDRLFARAPKPHIQALAARHEPELHRLSFGRGMIRSARFVGDGADVVYGAAWDGKPFHLFWARRDGRESRLVSQQNLDILAVSAKGQLAVLLDRRFSVGFISSGTLALMQSTSAEPRPLLADVQDADWSPSADELAIIHYVGDRCQLEFPVGTVLYQTTAGAWISQLRISPNGKRIAFLEHPLQGDSAGFVAVVDLSGRKDRLSGDFVDVQGLAWDPTGTAVWFSASEISPGGGRSIYKAALNGDQTLVRRELTDLTLQDVSRDGHILVSRDTYRQEVFGRIYPAQQERDLGWQDNSYASYLSDDGSTIVLSVMGEGAGTGYAVYIRGTQPNATAFRLGDGLAGPISNDGKWVLVVNPWGAKASLPSQLVLLPTGVGKARALPNSVHPSWQTAWLPDGRILFVGSEPGHGFRNWIMNSDGTQTHPITPEGTIGKSTSPNGELLAADAEGRFWLYSIHGGDRRPVNGMSGRDFPIGWSRDERTVFVARDSKDTTDVYKVNVVSGRRVLLYRLAPADRAGVTNAPSVLLTPDGRSYACSYFRILSDLYWIESLN